MPGQERTESLRCRPDFMLLRADGCGYSDDESCVRELVRVGGIVRSVVKKYVLDDNQVQLRAWTKLSCCTDPALHAIERAAQFGVKVIVMDSFGPQSAATD